MSSYAAFQNSTNDLFKNGRKTWSVMKKKAKPRDNNKKAEEAIANFQTLK